MLLQELKVNSRYFPDLKLDDIIEIRPLDRPDNKFLLRVENLMQHKGMAANFFRSISLAIDANN